MYTLTNQGRKRRRLNQSAPVANMFEPEPEMNIETIDNHIYYYSEVIQNRHLN